MQLSVYGVRVGLSVMFGVGPRSVMVNCIIDVRSIKMEIIKRSHVTLRTLFAVCRFFVAVSAVCVDRLFSSEANRAIVLAMKKGERLLYGFNDS